MEIDTEETIGTIEAMDAAAEVLAEYFGRALMADDHGKADELGRALKLLETSRMRLHLRRTRSEEPTKSPTFEELNPGDVFRFEGTIGVLYLKLGAAPAGVSAVALEGGTLHYVGGAASVVLADISRHYERMIDREYDRQLRGDQ